MFHINYIRGKSTISVYPSPKPKLHHSLHVQNRQQVIDLAFGVFPINSENSFSQIQESTVNVTSTQAETELTVIKKTDELNERVEILNILQ